MKNEIYLVMVYKPCGIKVPPFPLMYLSHSLKKEGYTTRVVHCTPSHINKYVEEIVKAEPLFVGFSVLSGAPTFYSLLMSRKIKKENKSIPIIWGGVHPSLLPQQCLEEKAIDIVVIGEGEETIVDVTNALAKNKPLKLIHGIGYKANGRIKINKQRPFIKNLDAFKLDFECVDLNNYVSQRKEKDKLIRTLGYYSSRGCPHNCGFCYNQQYNKRWWRAQSTSTVVKDINYLKERYNINKINLWDDNFFTNKKRAFEILEKIDIPAGADVRIDYIDEEFAKKLKELKVYYLLIGAESGNDRILRLIDKSFDTNRLLRGVEHLAKYNLKAQYSFILGLPTETKSELRDTVHLMLRIKKIHKQASFTIGMYLPYPGTKVFDEAIKNGFMPPKRTEDWYFIDRWTNTVKLPWIHNQLCLNIRHLSALLNWRWPFSWWARFRLRKGLLSFSQDLRFIIFFNLVLKNRLGNKIIW